MSRAFNLIYTYDLRGDLALLPRLYSQIKTLRGGLSGPTYLVDLGQSCVPEVWPCGVTEGRAALMVLDAMGYTAVQVRDVLETAIRKKIRDQVALKMVDAALPHIQDGIQFVASVDDADGNDAAITVVMEPGATTTYEGGIIRLAAVHGAQLGVVQVMGEAILAAVHDLPTGTPPDPTIAGVVDFVIAEARYYAQQRK